MLTILHRVRKIFENRGAKSKTGGNASWSQRGMDAPGCGRLPIGDAAREVTFLSNDYTNPNTNPKTFTTLILTLTDPHCAFESFCAPAFFDFIRNYSCTFDGAVVTSNLINNWWINSGTYLYY